MQLVDGQIVLSPSDLNNFIGCQHASALDLRALTEKMKRSADDPVLKLLQKAGLEHEHVYLASLSVSGRSVVSISATDIPDRRINATFAAMRQGADVIYQAALSNGMWLGYADFLVRTDLPSSLGTYSYEVEDTKLSSRVEPRHIIQLSIYSELLGRTQGIAPKHMAVFLGNGKKPILSVLEFHHYVQTAASRFEAFIGSAASKQTIPEPCNHCHLCPWRDRCKSEWETADHLSLVANIRMSQIKKLRGAGIGSLAALAVLPPSKTVPGLNPETLAKLHAQASMQFSVRGTDNHDYQRLTPVPGRGFARLPEPAKGDLFFDMEGDPLYPGGGLEYLFGVHWGSQATGPFKAFWGHNRDEERLAFEAFIDFVSDHLTSYPDAYIYHYNHYEVTAVRRLAMSHGTREEVVDNLLRNQRFVDLFKVVREALLVSEPRYSLKNMEAFYLGKRDGNVASAGESIVAYESWRALKDERYLREIQDYNEVDCRSTAGLRDWLVSIRPDGGPWFEVSSKQNPATELENPSSNADGVAAELLAAVPHGDMPFRLLVSHLVDFHRRAQKPEWWAMFDRQDRGADELAGDADCLGGLELDGQPVPVMNSLLHRYRFEPQETKLRRGSKPTIAATMEAAGTIQELNADLGWVELKRSSAKGPLPAYLSLGPEKPQDDKRLRAAVHRFAESVLKDDKRFLALKRLLRRQPPLIDGQVQGAPVIPDGMPTIHGAIGAVRHLNSSYLFVQGPPGTGKTYTASRIIVALLQQGCQVGISSNSHSAINNLLAGIERAAAEAGAVFNGFKKCTAGQPETEFSGSMIRNVASNKEVPQDAALVAGTAWLFADPERESTLDYLFVDEAGQVSLANLVAIGMAARNIVLFGDKMQLGQPIQGKHPGESGMSVLDYLLPDTATVQPDQGIFLDQTWRMHPDICSWVSEAIYDGRLHAHPSMANQALLPATGSHKALAPTGIHWVPVEHTGRSQRCPEEAKTVADIWRSAVLQRWRNHDGCEQEVGPEGVLVVAPYNAQVNAIRALLPLGARVGTVDKFQGQEAAMVILSMTTSSGEEMPRDAEFLFSRNRLNVAISRARCLTLIVSSPRLLEVKCVSINDMRLLSTFCHAATYRTALLQDA